MNILYGFINILVTFTLVILIEKLFKKEGLYVWLSIATILANLTVCKMIDVFSFTTSLGNVLFASTFLATDIMSEKYSKEDAKRGVYISIFSVAISIRTTAASMLMFFVSNMMDIHLYNKLKDKYPNKLWLRNNVATILCNCIENYFFNTLAFIGIFPMSVIISIATTTTIIEIVIAICDTPFLYISKYLFKTKKAH